MKMWPLLLAMNFMPMLLKLVLIYNWYYNEKQALQKILFPDGITYNRKTDTVQTPRTNSILELTCSLSIVLNKKESGQKLDVSNLSALVTPNIQSSNFLMQDLKLIGEFFKRHSIIELR